MKKPEKVIRDGKVAVLVSPGYGAGWASWSNDDLRDLCLFDRRFVEAYEAQIANGAPLTEEEISELAKEVTGDEYVYCGGWCQVRIEWLPVGTKFALREYDGSEHLERIEDLEIEA